MLKPTNNFHFQFLAASRTFSTPKIVFAGFRRPRTSHREAQGVEIRMLQGVGSAPKKALKAPTGEPDMQELPKQTQTLLVEFERMVDKYIRVIERYSSTAATQLTNPEHRSIAVIAIRTTNDTRPPSTNKTTPHRRNGQSNPAPQSTTSNPPTPPKSPSAQNSAPPTWKPSPPPPPDFAIIQQALHENQLLIFKGQQDLSPRAHYELTRLFGGKLRPRQVVGQEESSAPRFGNPSPINLTCR